MKSLKQTLKGIAMLTILFLSSISGFAQKSNRPITPGEQKAIIDKAFTLLKANYIFPGIIPAMENTIYKKASEGVYAKFTTAEDFIRNINKDLETLSNDRHIDIFFDPVRVKQLKTEVNNTSNKPAFDPQFVERARYENFMIRKVERMDGNVGYLKFNAFVDPDLSKSTIVAAMSFIANSDALIIDLRQNGGGDARTCAFLLNYFLPDSTLISYRRSRMTGENSPIYTATGTKKFPVYVPVYILTSKRTSSAAEAFSYTLQSYKRAVIVGDTTNGEANPGFTFAINNEMYIMIPAFENINPITKTNWQAKGITPDVKIIADKALAMVQAKAYEQLAGTTKVRSNKLMYEWMRDCLLAEINPLMVDEPELKTLTGLFEGDRHIVFTEGSLYYYKGENATNKKRLTPVKADIYGLEGVPYFRIRFIRNDNGKVTGIEGFYDDGEKEIFPKKEGNN